jgi:acetyl esterase/lipase
MSVDALADIHVEDIEYLRHPSGALLARIYRPKEGRPNAALVSMHGGRWTRETRLTNAVIDEALARDGALVMALDIRMPPVAGYPGCVADINYAIRWLKVYARMLGAPDRVGGIGTSSGGHQITLSALRPRDPRYAAPTASTRRWRLSSPAGRCSIRWHATRWRRQRAWTITSRRIMPIGRMRRRRPRAIRR